MPVDEPFVVVVDRDGQGDLRLVLSDDVFVERSLDLFGLREIFSREILSPGPGVNVIVDDVVARVYAVVADIKTGRRRDQEHDLSLAPSAEGARPLRGPAVVFSHFYDLSECVVSS